MPELSAYIVLVAAALLCVLLLVLVWLTFKSRRRSSHFEPPDFSETGARFVSKARYRGRRVFHYDDGGVLAETRRGFEAFENFDAYRYHVDRR